MFVGSVKGSGCRVFGFRVQGLGFGGFRVLQSQQYKGILIVDWTSEGKRGLAQCCSRSCRVLHTVDGQNPALPIIRNIP